MNRPLNAGGVHSSDWPLRVQSRPQRHRGMVVVMHRGLGDGDWWWAGGQGSCVGELLDLVDCHHLEGLDLLLSVQQSSNVLVLLSDQGKLSDDLKSLKN